jgi:hypothetical protein
MEILAKNPDGAFLLLNKHLLKQKLNYGLSVKYDCKVDFTPDELILDSFDSVWLDRECWKGGKKTSWRNWLIDGGFPMSIYRENECDLMRTINDKRTIDRSMSHKNSWHNFFGSLCRKNGDGKSFIEYFLERANKKDLKAHPHFYFEIECPYWIWSDLMKNPNQIKTGRSAIACCVNMYFRLNKISNRWILGWILKHCQWSHLFADIYASFEMGRAIFGCLNLGEFEVQIFFASIFNDYPKKLRQLLEKVDGKY